MTYNSGYPPQPPRQNAPMDGGYMYPNDKKVRAEQPDEKGKIRIGDDIVRRIMAGEREFWLSAWRKQDPKRPGVNFLSVKMKGMDPKPQYAQQYGAPPPPIPAAPAWAPPPGAGYGHHAVSTLAQYPTPQMPHGPAYAAPGHDPRQGYAAGPPQVPQGRPAAQGVPQTGVNWQGGGDEIPF